MKIGFLAYSLPVLEKYWEQLQARADCWWAVTQPDTLAELRRKGIDKIVFCPDEYQYIPDREGNKYVSAEQGKAEAKLAAEVDPDLWITDHTNRLTHAAKKALWIQTFHGLCFKKHTFHPLTLNYDLLLLPGEYHRQEFIRRLGFKEDDERLKLVGWPVVDPLIQGSYNRENILKALGLDPNRKTVMYAPTWGGYEKDMSTWGHNLFARWFGSHAEIFEQLCSDLQSKEINFIVKTHQVSSCSMNDELKQIAKRHGALWVTPGMSNFLIDPKPYLWTADVLVSDVSGIIMDYMVLNRPIVFIDPDDALDAWRDYSIPPNFRAGHVVRTPEQLLAAIQDSISNPDRHKAARQEVLNKIFCCLDGRSSQRAATAIMDFARAKGIA